MDISLTKLTIAIPPPSNPRFTEVDWQALENGIGLRYPQSFKEYVKVYGGAIWFDNWSPIYSTASNEQEIQDYLNTISAYTSSMKGHMLKGRMKRQKITLPLFPEEKGLLPFLFDYSGGVYSWKTTNSNSDKWPVVCWVDHVVTELRGISIAGMLLEFINRSKRMIAVWGDINDLEKDRIRVDRG